MLPDNFSIEVSIPTDEDGYLDRECPNEICGAAFKVLYERFKLRIFNWVRLLYDDLKCS